MNTKYLHVDLLTLTAHKIHGPKGTGLLFVKKGTPIAPQITGGDHEFRFRAGTENVAGIVGLAEAIKIIETAHKKIEMAVISNEVRNPLEHEISHVDKSMIRDDNYMRVEKLRNKLEDLILKNIPETYL